ncbi:type II secretion system GspH family protein [Sulfurimonas sp.]|nr:type II secretion system GspH family protein [Sulfurimonas sp.]
MRKAFTMLELIMVIVVIGILAVVVIPRTGSNALAEAAVQVISHIRYTQHLAMVDDKFDSTDSDWYKKRWRLIFGKSDDTEQEWAYTIYFDTATSITADNPNITFDEIAIDPLNKAKLLSGGFSGILNSDDSRANKNMNLGLSYGISNVNLSGGCTGPRIIFDNLGRPMQGTIYNSTTAYENSDIITSRCDITLTGDEGTITIAVEAETGYAHIL